ncbi:hypothetical protein M422DRAFT_263751 [Sphaerobolus stellatus SS14]|uniref:Uncharacterized protein n=1 Tax=Sphaerobolus stellatus (strain SS14) TaxID=990650 RepID=A0A0C9VA83_SPHS4|nr:hypothetical protein M422DRAFT_263751 [Sphaerobolus stellatus SS14]
MMFTALAAILLAFVAASIILKAARTVGAAYFFTNEPSGNFIVSNTIGADGKLSPGQVSWVGGVGQYISHN